MSQPEYPFLPVRIGDKIVRVYVCWDPQRVKDYLARCPDGIVPETGGPTDGTNPADRAWTIATARKIAGLPPLPTFQELLATGKKYPP